MRSGRRTAVARSFFLLNLSSFGILNFLFIEGGLGRGRGTHRRARRNSSTRRRNPSPAKKGRLHRIWRSRTRAPPHRPARSRPPSLLHRPAPPPTPRRV